MQPLLPLQPSNTTAIPKYFSYSVRWTLLPISVGRYLSLQRRFISTANLITGPCFHLHTLLFSTSIYPVLLWYESVLCYFICNRCQIWSDPVGHEGLIFHCWRVSICVANLSLANCLLAPRSTSPLLTSSNPLGRQMVQSRRADVSDLRGARPPNWFKDAANQQQVISRVTSA